MRRHLVTLHRPRAADAEIWRALRLETLELYPDACAPTYDDWAGRSLADFTARLEAGTVLGVVVASNLVGSAALDCDMSRTGHLTSFMCARRCGRAGSPVKWF